jgi:hydrogen peroxide-dependent heme synthase
MAPEQLVPTTGLNVLHLFVKPAGALDAAAVEKAVAGFEEAGGQVVAASILGHKADACLMALGGDVWALRSLQSAIEEAGLGVVDSFVSLTEVSEYAGGVPEKALQNRLYPQLPPEGLRAFCFYPMSKRRGEAHNWYALPYEDRKALMMGHGKSGREFSGRILQVITGSTGLDDWEWGVTLFGAHPDDLKDVVYTMRFDEASTLYAEFGPFYTGAVGTLDEVLASLPR